jgi:hypothetical protein
MSHVYFIQAGEIGPVKIGVANSPRQRLRELQTASSVPLRLLFAEDVCGREHAFKVEKKLHDILRKSHQHGEWFRFDSDIQWVIYLYGIGVSLADVHPDDFGEL